MNQTNRQKAHKDIDVIFLDIFPKYGLTVREAQVTLSHNMLDAIIYNKIALCDAGVGIGKTYAYLVASVIFNKYSDIQYPILVSTASIALQNAIINDYIPFISDVLSKNKIIDFEFKAIIRKGKGHYVCDERLIRRLTHVNVDKKNIQQMQALLSLKSYIDLDSVSNLSTYDKKQVCVPNICECISSNCRYKSFVKQSKTYMFQICNHNFLLADAIHRIKDITSLLPDCCAVIIDEAHKIPDSARQMFGKSINQNDMKQLLFGLKSDKFILAARKLLAVLKPFVVDLENIDFEESINIKYSLNNERKRLISKVLKVLISINTELRVDLGFLLLNMLDEAILTFTLFLERDPNYVYYAYKDENGKTALFATISDITDKIQAALWLRPLPFILTSGTLAIGDDFSRFRIEAGLSKTAQVNEFVACSPFDYMKNSLLYFPKNIVRIDDSEECFDSVAKVIQELLNTANGHTLVLFTSYSMMSAVYSRLNKEKFPMFILGRNHIKEIELFRNSGNGVLFATGVAWEGIDFPGDIVSSLIIVRLPFSSPDPLTEHKKQKFHDLTSFIENIIVPDMQIKLKQGVGRAIRTETDTCVITILDKRSHTNQRYYNDVIRALPSMPVTSNIDRVARFLHSVKSRDYFKTENN